MYKILNILLNPTQSGEDLFGSGKVVWKKKSSRLCGSKSPFSHVCISPVTGKSVMAHHEGHCGAVSSKAQTAQQ